jgi:ectoine hydroxylase-related dioxygenase (phytanoyl-CoA dioxygenase family)
MIETRDARCDLNHLISETTMNSHQQEQLEEQGYVTLESLMTPHFLTAVQARVDELFELEGDAAGSEFKQEPQSRRLANVVNKGDVFLQVIRTPEVLACVELVLGKEFKLSSLNVRSANPHSDWVQPLHVDGGFLPDEKGYCVCNSVWMLDDFTIENGATRLIPGSHRWRRRPADVLQDLTAPHPEEILLTGKAGTVVVMNAHVWHGGTANRTGRPRRALHSYYTRNDKPQQLYQKRFLDLDVQARLSPQLRKLLALDDPLNDEISSRISGMSGFLK